MNITDEFKTLWKNKAPDVNMLLPLLRWCSGYEKNIEETQRINKMFTKVNKHILNRKLALTNKLTHFIPFPKIPKEDEKIKFFYRDLAKYYGWTPKELNKNLKGIDVEKMKEEIAIKFGYSNFERKKIGIRKIKCLK